MAPSLRHHGGPAGLSRSSPRSRDRPSWHTDRMDPINDEGAFAWCICYRLAFGHAWRALERDRIGPNAPGRDPRMQLDALTRWVAAEMGDREASEAVAEGVKDAVERRQPRW